MGPTAEIRRPNTIAPTQVLQVDSAYLESMTDDQLIAFADQYLSIPIERGSPRGRILTKITNAAFAAKDGVV